MAPSVQHAVKVCLAQHLAEKNVVWMLFGGLLALRKQ